MLLTIEQIKHQLKDKFSTPDGELDDLILIERETPSCDVESIEESLNLTLPKEYNQFCRKFNIDNFSLGPISFGIGNNYIAQIIELNKEEEFNRWWTDDQRPNGMIAIATSDPYTILLNTINGHVYAITSESNTAELMPIASNFELFIRGIGTIFLKQESPLKVITLVHSQNVDFWNDI